MAESNCFRVVSESAVSRFIKRCRPICRCRSAIFAVCIPLLLLPVVLKYRGTNLADSSACCYVICVMGVFWVFEIIPIAATALMPVFMFPLLGVLTVEQASTPYFSPSCFLFFGGLVVALSVEEVNLHKRLALRVLMLTGSDPKWIMLGFMTIAWFLSMWISNTATAAMMLPIAVAVINELTKHDRSAKRYKNRCSSSEPMINGAGHLHPLTVNHADTDEAEYPNLREEKHLWSPRELKLAKAVLLSLCYSSNIGGTATLTGTVPNIIAVGQLEKHGIRGVTFANWMAFQLPASGVLLILSWVWLLICFFPLKSIFSVRRRHRKVSLSKTLESQYRKLGPVTFAEYCVLVLFFVLMALWVLRDPHFMRGWGTYFKPGYVNDTVPVMVVAVLLFVIPRAMPCYPRSSDADPLFPTKKQAEPLMTWTAMKKFPWDVILILGGGFSLASGVAASGLSKLVADALRTSLVGRVSPQVFCLLVVTVVTFFTEVTSNASTANIFTPILISLSDGIGVHPFYLTIPVAVSCSLAFMIPVATPPNAIVFGVGVLKVTDMMTTGFVLNWIGIGTTLLCANFILPAVLNFELNANLTAYNILNVTENTIV